jgi:hypothetical protein
MVKIMVKSTFSSINVHEVVDDTSNRYRSMVIDTMRMNQGNACECSIIDKESNTYTTRFFYILKDSDELL